MKFQTLLCVLFVGFISYAQNNFQKGYLINNNGKKIQAFIENEEWLNNPETIKYKLTIDGEVYTFTKEDVKEFAAFKKFKYKRFDIVIDNQKTQQDENVTAFLKAVVEADQVSLYTFNRNDQKRFYYQKANQKITLLRYNESTNSSGEIVKNSLFRKQLSENLYASCPNLSLDVGYTSFQLGNYIIFYNNCNQVSESLIDFREYELIGSWYFKIKAGVNISTVDIRNRTGRTRKENGTNLRFGFEVEHFLKLKNKTWSIFLEPTFSYFDDDRKGVNHSSIEIPLGLRKYIPISYTSRVFINAGASADISMGTTIDGFSTETGIALFYGIGYEFNQTFSLEARNYTTRSFPTTNNLIAAEQGNFALILGYKF